MSAESGSGLGQTASGPPAESPVRAVWVTLLVCGLCSAAIASAVTWLRPYQQAHREADRSARIRQMVAAVPGLETALGALGTARIESRAVELETGRYAPEVDPESLDPHAAQDPAQSLAIPPDEDIAGLRRRARHAVVHEVRDASGLRLLILPVYGAGYISTLYGYLALDPDTRTVRGLDFYEQEETPGLGSEIESPAWRALWPGKQVRDASGKVRLGVAMGPIDPDEPEAAYLVDGISGATETGDGVTALLRFWLGPQGFGPYLARLAVDRPEAR